ncbi:MAG: YnfA family protein, partial [Acinetobacter sp.]|nr:YnfA family protein [Acinetobacter sp.]
MAYDIWKILSTLGLFVVTAIAEISGCYFPYLILNKGKTAWLWLPTALSLMLFVWLLTLHPAASGRIYAAYGGVYIFTALMWLYWVDQVALSRWDLLGGAIVLVGALVIILQPNGLLK